MDASFWEYAEMMEKYVNCSTVKNASENGSDKTGENRTTTCVVRNAPDGDHQKDGCEQVPGQILSVCTHTHRSQHEEIDDAVSDEHAHQVGDIPSAQRPSHAQGMLEQE